MPRRVRLLTVALAAAGVLLMVSLSSVGASTRPGTRGLQLVNRFFSDVQGKKVADLKKFLSSAFQLQRADGTRQSKAQFLAKLPTVKSYKLRDTLETSAGPTIVVTYQVAANEVIDGKPYQTGYLPRISVFVNGPQGWQFVAHSNFNTPK
jgi:protein-disulfide isomerase